MQVWNLLHAVRWNTGCKKLPSGHHRTNLSGWIFATKTCRQSEKNLLTSNISSTCPHNMANCGPLTVEIGSVVWGTSANFNGFRVFARYAGSGRQPNVAALNRRRHLYSAGRPSRWTLAHILVSPWCGTSSEKCLLLWHHFLSTIVIMRTLSLPTDLNLFE